jgi:hypothetical protein
MLLRVDYDDDDDDDDASAGKIETPFHGDGGRRFVAACCLPRRLGNDDT